ncbi:hypothetical protein GALL_490440 [mine drainage metagenome]|uniref:Uncharacterized protein n=1 Tax=mine drainage metagenome TaxID=410659 RepID=A0A1J5PDE6_9ZZZZ
MGFDQLFDRLQNPLIFTTDQNERAGIVVLNQVSDKLNTIHLRHVDVEQDQVGALILVVDYHKRCLSAITSSYLEVTLMGQYAAEQLEHERFIVKDQNPEFVFIQHGRWTE